MQPTSEQVPATDQLSLERFVVFELNSEEYAVPINSVTEVVPYLEIVPVPGSPAYILGLINLRGKVIPVLDLEEKFHLPHGTEVNRQHIMIAEGEKNVLFGIVVDYVHEVLKVPGDVVKPAPEAVKSSISTEYVGGVIVLNGDESAGGNADERILLVLDLQKILSDANVEELHAAQAGQASATTTNEGGTV